MSKLLPRDREKFFRVRQMFNRIAKDYDFLNRRLSLGLDQYWRRRTIQSVHLCRGDIVVDLACGTGELCSLATQAGARVVGVDFSRNMLLAAKKKQTAAALVEGDANAIPMRNASATVVVSGFALRNFVSIEEALREIARVLASGGRLALLEVDVPTSPFLRLGHSIYFGRLVPFFGGLKSDPLAYSYLPRSMSYLPSGPALLELIRSAGFSSVNKINLTSGVVQLITAVRDYRS